MRYVGICCDVSFGDGYTIGYQTVDEFLNQDPLDEKMPATLIAEIRAYLVSAKEGRGGNADRDGESSGQPG